MGRLTSFILNEGLKSRHVLALHNFNELFKHDVIVDIKAELVARWTATVKRLGLKVPKDVVQDAVLRGVEKPMTKPIVGSAVHKLIVNGEHHKPREVSPTVKIPLLMAVEQRELLLVALLEDAQAAFQNLLTAYPAAFLRPSKTNELRSDFKIERSKITVRLCIASKDGHVEHSNCLLYVSIEHGKPNSKTRPFDVVYLGVPV